MFHKLEVGAHGITGHCALDLAAEEHALELEAAAEASNIFAPVVLKIQESSLIVISFLAHVCEYTVHQKIIAITPRLTNTETFELQTFVRTTSQFVSLDQGCELDRFLTEFKFEFKRYLLVRVQVRVLEVLLFEFKFEF